MDCRSPNILLFAFGTPPAGFFAGADEVPVATPLLLVILATRRRLSSCEPSTKSARQSQKSLTSCGMRGARLRDLGEPARSRAFMIGDTRTCRSSNPDPCELWLISLVEESKNDRARCVADHPSLVCRPCVSRRDGHRIDTPANYAMKFSR